MITLNVLELLKKKGKTKYWLYMQLGMSYQNFVICNLIYIYFIKNIKYTFNCKENVI